MCKFTFPSSIRVRIRSFSREKYATFKRYMAFHLDTLTYTKYVRYSRDFNQNFHTHL